MLGRWLDPYETAVVGVLTTHDPGLRSVLRITVSPLLELADRDYQFQILD